jgi:DNA (cytosine-5)-methyltransferase 1
MINNIDQQLAPQQVQFDDLLTQAESTPRPSKTSNVDEPNGSDKRTITTPNIDQQIKLQQVKFANLLTQAHSTSGVPEAFNIDEENRTITRTVTTRDGEKIESTLPMATGLSPTADPCSLFDYSWLRLKDWPSIPTLATDKDSIQLVDLFSGCGGLSMGIWEACRALGLSLDNVLAADIDEEARKNYAANFACKQILEEPLDQVINGDFNAPPTASEEALIQSVEQIDLLVGGPPCQGHSNLNNHTRHVDPKNELILRMARFAQLVDVRHIIIENVPTIVRDRTNALQTTREMLHHLGYNVQFINTLNASDYGVAQNRNRFFLVASKDHDVHDIEKNIKLHKVEEARTFMWACGDLENLEADDLFNTQPDISDVNKERIRVLFEENRYELRDKDRPDCHKLKDHTYPSVYGRLRPDEPSPTITRGFGGMGQGRYVHPTKERMITPHEAARLQFFPDFFQFDTEYRKSYQHMIGNAVPSKFAYLLALHLLR